MKASRILIHKESSRTITDDVGLTEWEDEVEQSKSAVFSDWGRHFC